MMTGAAPLWICRFAWTTPKALPTYPQPQQKPKKAIRLKETTQPKAYPPIKICHPSSRSKVLPIIPLDKAR